MIEIIDSHLHFFALDEGHYGWLKPQNPPHWPDKHKLVRSVSESDLQLHEPLSLAGFVHIEAGFDNTKPWREIDWLAQHCQRPYAAVAFWDLLAAEAEQTLEALLQRPKVSGVRYILDDDGVAILSHPLIAQRFALLQEAGLGFDVQLPLSATASVQALLSLIRQFPGVRFIINHAGFPFHDTHSQNPWRQSLNELAKSPNVAIKLSGWEMQDRQWSKESVRHVMAYVLDVFGHERVMLGSNFPLCLWHSSYKDFWQTMVSLVAPDTRNQVACTNARHWYQISG
ncbi:amidohydrolase family protein [Alteromonas sp. 14N.309.X.WAT.G.H12]|uniref:amidohydrolase family protein n=1 Tax=Alteromonas sp. 14N.309.X.WAT.G.H12 TaxID=3120824 RepID=UPI002FD440E9